MTIPTRIDQTERGLGRNISHTDKELFNKMLEIYLLQIQDLQDNTLALADMRNIDEAFGIWLDYIGKIVGVPRSSRSDEDYRAAIKFQIALSTADGTPNNIIDLTTTFTNATSSQIREYPWGSFVNSISSSEVPHGDLYDLVDNIKPAGVGATVIHNLNGVALTPAWGLSEGGIIVDEGLLIDAGDNGDFLLLDDGEDDQNYLVIGDNITEFYGDTTYSYLSWLGTSNLNVVIGGVENNFVTTDAFSVNTNFNVVTSTEGDGSGVLAELVIPPNSIIGQYDLISNFNVLQSGVNNNLLLSDGNNFTVLEIKDLIAG